MGFPLEAFYVLAPAVALITFLNLRSVKFCNTCGKTLINQIPFTAPKFCSKCGAKLENGDT
jgi:hypothetical protein